jgi:hypothetical protein
VTKRPRWLCTFQHLARDRVNASQVPLVLPAGPLITPQSIIIPATTRVKPTEQTPTLHASCSSRLTSFHFPRSGTTHVTWKQQGSYAVIEPALCHICSQLSHAPLQSTISYCNAGRQQTDGLGPQTAAAPSCHNKVQLLLPHHHHPAVCATAS